MKYLLLLSFLFLAGCEISTEEDDRDAIVNITCYDAKGEITVRRPHTHGYWKMVNDKTLGYWSQKCIVERAE